MFNFRAVALAFTILSPVQADWIAWMTQDPVKVAEAYVAEWLPAFKSLDTSTLGRLYSTHCVFGNPDAGQPTEQKDSLMVGMKSVGLDHESKAFRDKIVGMKIMSAVSESAPDWESDVTGAKHAMQVTAWVKVEMEGQSDFYQWAVLVPFEGAENGWTATAVLASPDPVSHSTEFLEQPSKEVADASASIPALPAPRVLASRDDAVKIAEAYAAEWLPAFKKLDAKLEGLYSADCVFGSPDKTEGQKDVLTKGMKSVGLDHASDAFRDEVKGMEIVSAVSGITAPAPSGVPVRITALVKVEAGKDTFYQWAVLVPSGSWHGDVWKSSGWVAAAILAAPTPASRTAELLEQPRGDASVSVAALPASLALLATFASGVLVSGCFFGRKEVFARLTAPRALREPLL
jgi:ketosteroid isomerase-like protein